MWIQIKSTFAHSTAFVILPVIKFPEINNPVKTPELDVVRVVSLKVGQVILVQEIDDLNWKLPGGKIHENETIFQALVRETEEEPGLTLAESDILNYIATNIPNSENIRHIFLMREVRDTELKSTEEVAQAGYFSLNELPNTKFKEHITTAVQFVSNI